MKVLEAVHLLLAFPLFVCVVAVDPRWIEKCVNQKHPQLMIDGGPQAGPNEAREDVRVTVGDYLEKIFQIPIWMSPIDGRQRAVVVQSLLGTTAAPEPKGHSARKDARTGEPEQEAPHPEPEGAPEGGDPNAFRELVARASDTPDPLRISEEESSFVEKVGPLLSDKPRALKRFVNTYRLLKASLSDIDRQSFVSDDPSSPYRICISQLALFTGQPRLAPALVKQITRTSHPGPSVRDWVLGLPEEDRGPLEQAVSQIPDCGEMQLATFRDWIPDTSKYLFHRAD